MFEVEQLSLIVVELAFEENWGIQETRIGIAVASVSPFDLTVSNIRFKISAIVRKVVRIWVKCT